MSKLEIKNVTARIKNEKKNTLININLSFDEGDFVAIIGPSGAGKTTLLNLLVNDLEIVEGEVVYDNIMFTKANKKIFKNSFLSKVGMLSQQPNLIYNDDVFTNIKRFYKNQNNIFARMINHVSKNSFAEIENILDKIAIKKYIFTPVKSLSGGQQQRVEIAKLLLKKPKIILADEPTTGLDIYNSENVLKMIKNVAINSSAITFINLHDLSLINEKYFNRVIALRDGEVVYDLKVEQLEVSTITKIYKENIENEEKIINFT